MTQERSPAKPKSHGRFASTNPLAAIKHRSIVAVAHQLLPSASHSSFSMPLGQRHVFRITRAQTRFSAHPRPLLSQQTLGYVPPLARPFAAGQTVIALRQRHALAKSFGVSLTPWPRREAGKEHIPREHTGRPGCAAKYAGGVHNGQRRRAAVVGERSRYAIIVGLGSFMREIVDSRTVLGGDRDFAEDRSGKHGKDAVGV